MATTALLLALGSALVAPSALAEDLDGLRAQLSQVEQQQGSAQSEVTRSVAEVESATVRLLESRNALENAQARLSDVRVQLAAAREFDANVAAQLKAAQDALAAATSEVARGEAALQAQLRLIGVAARDAYQQQNPLEGLSVVFDAGSTSDLSQRIQWNTTILDSQAAEKARLDDVQAELNAARDRQAQAEAEIAEQKKAAARQVAVVRGLEQDARARASAVDALVASNDAARVAAQAELESDRGAYDQLAAQEDTLRTEIQSEITRLRAEAEQRAREEAELRAREEAELRAREEAARRAEEAAAARRAADAAAREAAAKAISRPAAQAAPAQAAPVQVAAPAATAPKAATPTRAASDPTGYGVSRYGLIRPVAARNGSPFGMRFHPILRYWRMHNGTDFGAATGTPLYAAADGVVLKSGPNGGFGNFVLIGHNAEVGGKYVTTGYAHQSRIIVKVGQKVRRGQLIGYVGSTGLSTTPHLHFEVRLDGVPVDPMNYIP